MKKNFLTFVIILIGLSAQAQIPSGYYDNANGKTGDELKAALHDIIKDHTTITYGNLWNAFWSTDNKGNGVVWDMYSDIPNGTPPYIYQMGQNQCGGYEQEGDCYNREHSWPQSWFSGNDQSTPSRDLHHVFPTDGFVNSQRSNHPFGEVSNATWTSQNGSKLGTCKSSLGYSGTVFEPIDEYKGDFARALMYMSVRYYTEDSDWSTSGMTEKSVIKPWAIAMLLNWSDNDPVSQKEIDRNNVIYSDYQHNRNPFIDYPDYAHMIWDGNWSGNGDYVKVTSQPEDWSGDYLIVYETGNKAFNGSLETLDVAGNTIDISVIGGTITATDATIAAQFTIAKSGNYYTIKSASGKYIGQTSNANGLVSSDTPLNNTITFNQGDVDIVSSNAHLRYNGDNGQKRFRYFKSSTYTNQQAIQLFKKNELYTITCVQVEHGTISANLESALEGTTILLTVTPESGYDFDHWTVTDALGNNIQVTGNQFVMPASDVTVSASFVNIGIFTQEYQLVTSTDQLVAGKNYLIVNTSAKKALGKTQNTNNRSAAAVTIENNVITTLGDACELTLGGQVGAWTLYDATNKSGYLYAAGGTSNNYLKTQTTLTDAGRWTISLNNNKATIKTIATNVGKHTIMYNSSSNIFSCYASGQQDVCLFVQTDVFEKDIAGYTVDGGWYTIAAPFADFKPSQIAIGDYDLYAYDENGNKEWINYKANTTDFPVGTTSGYLYAHSPNTTLRITGTLNSDDYTSTVNLSYANDEEAIKGFNLLGNPTRHSITFDKSGNVSDGYYYLDNSETWMYEASNNVPTGRGFLVKSNAVGQTVTLNPQTRRGSNDDIYLCFSIDDDKAYVKMNEGVSMPLLALNGNSPRLFLTNGGKSYVMLVRDQADNIELNYQPSHQGQHNLYVNAKDLNVDYLHLIDRLTGTDIDLLATPTYSFESHSTDYSARFQLRFAPAVNNDIEEGDFAYYADGKLHLFGDYENASLQIIDMTGRQVNTITSGVYVLRLITPEKTRVQKIIIY